MWFLVQTGKYAVSRVLGKLWVYYQLMKLPWPYDKRPVALNNREAHECSA